MAADLHIHIWTEEITEDDLNKFFGNSLGHKRAGSLLKVLSQRSPTLAEIDARYNKISNTPDIWIGQVSWLKAMVFEDSSFIPDPIQTIHDLYVDEPLIDDKLIASTLDALNESNRTGYDVTDKIDEVREFLLMYKGKRAFTVSW
jgi:hypothetical protein